MARRGLRERRAVEVVTAFAPGIALLHRHDLGQIHALQSRKGARRGQGVVFRHARAGEDAAVLRAGVAQDAREATRVDLGDRHDAVALQVGVEGFLRAPVAREQRQVADHESRGVHRGRFGVLGIAAGVADVRIGQGDDLSCVGRIGQDFLVAGHRRVEHDFADSPSFRTDGYAAEDRSVRECE